MWEEFRKFKTVISAPILGVGLMLLQGAPESSLPWFVGLGLVLFSAAAYLIEEIAWNIKGRGRPCAYCGNYVPMQSFRIRNTCPYCGARL